MIDRLNPDYSDLPGRRPVAHAFSAGAHQADHIDISVLTPYFNTEAFFTETWVSIQAQTLQNWEWIIVDDGSTDPAAVERLHRVAGADARIQVIRQDNAGPSAARNRAFSAARGRYVCLLDSDDMVETTYFEKCVWFLDANPAYAFCNAWSVVFGDQEYLWTTGFERNVAHLQANSGPPISVIRHGAFAESGGFDESIRFGHEDWDFWLSMAQAGHWGFTLPEYLQWYRKRGNGRFEQIMRADGVNAKFEATVRKKFEGLAHRFPNPQRTHSVPYVSFSTASEVSNALVAPSAGRSFLFLIPWMVTGGADRVNLDLIEGLVAEGHRVTVCATLPADHGWEHNFSRFTTDIFVLPNFLATQDYPRFLAYLIASRQVDTVLITGSTLGYQLVPYLRSTAPHVAYLDMSHVEELHWNNGGHPRFGVGYQDQLDLNIVTTRRLSQWMQSRGAEAARIAVMYTGIRTSATAGPSDERVAVRTRYGLPQSIPIIVFAGRLCDQKRPLLLAQILKACHDAGIVFHALIIGDGELKGAFESLIRQYQMQDMVSLLGSLPHAEWLRLLGASDVLLMPSQYEGISVALLEAMAAGVVPVVADVGGQSEIVSASAGVLVPHGDQELQTYVAALHKLLTDPDARAGYAQSSRQIAASQLSWPGMIRFFLGLVDQAHALRVSQPRQVLPAGFAKEVTTLALENKRLGDAVEWLWHAGPQSPASAANPALTATEVQVISRVAVRLGQTWLVRRLIRNRLVKSLARWVLTRASRVRGP